jgi:phosphoserine phosphatase
MIAPQQRVHAFDLDNTLVPGCLTERAVWKIAERAPLTSAQMTWLDELNKERSTLLRPDGRLMSTSAADAYIWRAVDAFMDINRGVPFQTMRRIAAKLAEEDAAAIYPEMLTKIEEIHAAGEIAVIISASPALLVSAFARRIGAAASAGSRYYRQGNEMHRWRPSRNPHPKDHTLRAMCSRLEGQAVAAYGDTMNDKPMLNSVTYPHAVNPVPELRDQALKNGWQIINCATH